MQKASCYQASYPYCATATDPIRVLLLALYGNCKSARGMDNIRLPDIHSAIEY